MRIPDLPRPGPDRSAIEGRWCRLEPLSPAHAGDLHRAVAGGEAGRLHAHLPDHPPTTPEDTARWTQAAAASTDPMFFAVVDRRTGRVGGRQALMRITPAHGVIEIGHILWGPEIARTRVATEAVFLLADLSLRALGYRRLEWKCDAANAPSRRAAERFGFRFEGVFRQHMVVKGRNRDTAWHALLDHEFAAIRTGYLRWLAGENFDAAGRQIRRLADCIGGDSFVARAAEDDKQLSSKHDLPGQ